MLRREGGPCGEFQPFAGGVPFTWDLLLMNGEIRHLELTCCTRHCDFLVFSFLPEVPVN